MSTRLRFPPSPTGKMHIGNARTALFNWLYARHTAGSFSLRIEDTDKERSTPENIAFIYEALEWLGIDWDNEPFLQTGRVDDHIAAAKKLVSEDKAYTDDQGVTRFRVAKGTTSWSDMVLGEISIENTQVEDFALLRSDGTPTYHLGVVCDDIHMGITHIIRGADHVSNTPKHIMLFEALNHPKPWFGHLPLINGPDGHKLSKRHGAASVQDLRDMGYLPDAVINYMARLGWSHGDDEIFSREDLIRHFDIQQVHQSAAQYDLAKLTWTNAHYLKTMPMDEVLPHLVRFIKVEGEGKKRLAVLWPDLTARATTLLELAAAAKPVLGERPAIAADHQADLSAAQGVLAQLAAALQTQTEWNRDALDATIKHVQKESGEPFKVLGHGLRLALIGDTQGPPLAALVEALGQDEVLKRLA